MSGLAESYRINLAEARRALEIAQSVKDEFKRQNLIRWGMSRTGFEGWLVEGKKADASYSSWAMAQSDLEHWSSLLTAEVRLRSVPEDRRLPPEKDDEPMTPEQVEAQRADLGRQFAEWQARNGEATP